jgi:DNA-binding CsgD family transcriptional regulator
MEEKLLKQKDEGEEVTVIPEAAYPEMTITERAKKVEDRVIDPKTLNKKECRQLAMYYKSRGYSADEISECLKVSPRTVLRYIETVRAENSVNIGRDCQKVILGEFISGLKSRCQRLLKTSYFNDLPPFEMVKVLCMLHQMEKDGIEILEKLGYLSKSNTFTAMKTEEEIDYRKELKRLDKKTKDICEQLSGAVLDEEYAARYSKDPRAIVIERDDREADKGLEEIKRQLNEDIEKNQE